MTIRTCSQHEYATTQLPPSPSKPCSVWLVALLTRYPISGVLTITGLERTAKASKINFSFCRIAFRRILGSNEPKGNIADDEKCLYTQKNSYYACFFSTHGNLSQNSHTFIILTYIRKDINFIIENKVQSHPNTTRAYRRLSLAALDCPVAGQRAIILKQLPNTHSVISVYFPSRWSRASTYICEAETLAFTDRDFCQTLAL